MSDPRLCALPLAVWELLALAAICLFFATVILLCLCLRYRRRQTLALCLVLLPGSYLLAEGFLVLQDKKSPRGAAHFVLKSFVLDLPPWVLIAEILGLVGIMALLLRRMLRYGRGHITPRSVKEAVDTLPVGICCFRPWGRIVLVNTAMEKLCQGALGGVLINGRDFRDAVTLGPLRPGCRRADLNGEPLLLLSDGTAWSFNEQSFDWEGALLTALLASDVSEAYRKTLDLEEKNRQLTELNRLLAIRNREIVDLTIQSEILAARVRLHDAMGEDLLTMKKLLLTGGDEQDPEALRARLRRNISFLREENDADAADEFEVLLQTAGRLGVRVEITGELPREGEQRRVVATGLHENLTNLLRHARGNLLRMELQQKDGALTVRFSGNSTPPAGPVREIGGLRMLRTMTEELGGHMTVTCAPVFTVTLELPKEEQHGL